MRRVTYQFPFPLINLPLFSGNDYLHVLTSRKRQILRIDMSDWKGNTRYAEYDNFKVGSERTKYRLISVGKYSGTASQYFDNVASILLFLSCCTCRYLRLMGFVAMSAVVVWHGGSSVNEVNLCRVRLVLRWVTVSGFNSRCPKFISVYVTMPSTPTKPSIPSGSVNEDQLRLGKQRQFWFKS